MVAKDHDHWRFVDHFVSDSDPALGARKSPQTNPKVLAQTGHASDHGISPPNRDGRDHLHDVFN